MGTSGEHNNDSDPNSLNPSNNVSFAQMGKQQSSVSTSTNTNPASPTISSKSRSGIAPSILIQHQQQQHLGALEIETVYQLLSVSANESKTGHDSKENEWMYLLERQGGAELHDMGVAFDAFRTGNLSVASTLFNGLATRASKNNVADRYVTMRCKQLASGVNNAPLPGMGNMVQSSSTPTTLNQQQQQHQQPRTSSSQSGQASKENSQGLVENSFPETTALMQEAHSGGHNHQHQFGGGGNSKRIALEAYFSELKQQGMKYGRRIHVTGVDDFLFE